MSSNYVVCPRCKGDYWSDPFRKCSNCLNGRVLATEPAPDAGDEWRVAAVSDASDGDATIRGYKNEWIGTVRRKYAAQIVTDHTAAAAVPKLVEALQLARKMILAVWDEPEDPAETTAVRHIDAALKATEVQP